jgi:hypothetical protein
MNPPTRGAIAAALLWAASFCNACLAQDNPLIGSWKWDNNKTLQNFRMPTEGTKAQMRSAAKAKAFVENAAAKLNSNMSLTYDQTNCREVIVDGKGSVLSDASYPYKIVKSGKGFLIVDQPGHGGKGKLFLEGNSFYVAVKVDDFSYRDYFTKLP